MATIAHANSVTRVATSAEFPLGFEVEVPATAEASSVMTDMGTKTYIYVYNDSGSPLAVAKMQTRKAATATYIVAESGAISPCLAVGLCVTAIPNLSYGFLLRKGVGTVDAAGVVAPNSGLILIADGEVVHAVAIVDPAFGNSLGGKGGGTGTFTAYVDCRG